MHFLLQVVAHEVRGAGVRKGQEVPAHAHLQPSFLLTPVWSCTSNLRLIRQPDRPGTIPSLLYLCEGFCHGLPSLFLPVDARRLGVAVYHAPLGVAKRLRYRVLDDTGAPTPTAQAQPRAATLCGPHHQAARRRLYRCERRPPPPPPRPTPAHRHDARTPPPGGYLHAFLPQSRLCLSGLGGLGQSPRQRPSQWRSLATAAVRGLPRLLSRDPRHA